MLNHRRQKSPRQIQDCKRLTSQRYGATVDAGHKGGHSNKDHHHVQNSVLPGIFFIYEISPFAVEISQNSVPLTHLLIRLIAIIGGVFTCASWLDAALCAGDSSKRKTGMRVYSE